MLLVLLAGLGTWLGYSLSRTAPHHSTAVSVPSVRGLAGVVLAETPGGYLSETDMRTGQVVVAKNLGEFSSSPAPAISLDGKYLYDAAVARLVSLSSPGHLQTVPNALSFSNAGISGFAAYPWTDHDNGVVEPTGPEGYLTTTTIAVAESVRTGQAFSLGTANSVGGDPQQEGAFIAVPGTGQPLPDGTQPDAGVALADAGSRTHLLATTSQLERALGIKDGTTVSLVPIPSPQGSMVAVQVLSIGGGAAGGQVVESPAGVVVLSRNGALLGSQPIGFGWAGWSHSGSTLAFVSYTGAAPGLTEWTVGVRSVATVLRKSSRFGPTACVWSPDDSTVICDGGPHGTWLVIRSGTASVTAGHGQPLAWTDGRLAR